MLLSAVRLALLAALLLVLPGGREGQAAPPRELAGAGLLRAASHRLAHGSPSDVVRWLRHQPGVAADLGLDRQTVEVRLRNGLQAAILPSAPRGRGLHISGRELKDGLPQHTTLLPLGQGLGSGRRALILMPFATDLNLMPHAQELERELQAAGFTVDVVYDGDVTVATMSGLSRYDLVYMATHSGVNKYGDVVIATGQQADPNSIDPQVAPYIQEGSAMVTEISGSSLLYYGVRSRFLRDHEDGQFPANSLVYFNSCSLSKGSLLWQALSGRNVATMLGWDGYAGTTDDAPTADAFFSDMLRGDTVGDALAAMDTIGRDTSYWAGKTAHLRYLGDSTLTLDGRSSATPTALPTETAIPTDVPPTSTPVPTATSTPLRLPPLSVTLRSAVRPGDRQVINAVSAPRMTVRFRVTYPNGDIQQAVRVMGAAGRARYAYIQPANKTRPGKDRASVVVSVSGPTGTTIVHRHYTILGSSRS